jgi:hypothetical protein
MVGDLLRHFQLAGATHFRGQGEPGTNPTAHHVLSTGPAVRLRTTGQSLFQPERRGPCGRGIFDRPILTVVLAY